MKKYIFLLILVLGFSSCEDVIELDLNTAEPRLVIEASINILKESNESYQSFIRLTETTSFYSEEIPAVTTAIVSITDEDDEVFTFTHTENGYYTGDFSPQENKNYRLEVVYNDEIYSATASLQTTSALEDVEQKDDGGFLGDQIELKVFYTDPEEEENFYYFVALCERGNRRSVSNDEFYNGNKTFLIYTHEDLVSGDEVIFHLYGTSEGYYNYMSKILQQTGGGGPFDTPPASIRGNIINETSNENYPLGFFRISEVSVLQFTVE